MKDLTRVICCMSILLFLGACTSDPKSHQAEVSEAQEVEKVMSELRYNLGEGSVVTWVGTKPTGRHNGTIAVSSGAIDVKDGNIVGGSLMIDMNNIEALDLKGDQENYGKLIGHLKSDDFFDVGNHPTSQFVLTSIEGYSANDSSEEVDAEFTVASPTHTITGNLTLRGTTLSLSFPAKVTITEAVITVDAKFNIDRTRWGVSYGDESAAVDKAKDKFIYNTVNIGFSVTAQK